MTPQHEITQFWQAALEQMRATPMNVQVTDNSARLPHWQYELTLHGLDGVPFRASLSKPIVPDGARLPALVTAPGYGGWEQGALLGECQRGYILLQVFPRGQGPSAELWSLPDGEDKLTGKLNGPSENYYRGGYADVVRGIDYLRTRPDVDPGRIGLIGTSQGGGLVLAAGALEPNVRAVVAHVPFLCDYRQCVHLEDSLLHTLVGLPGLASEEVLSVLDYFDALVLGARITAPTLLSSGGLDRICPVASIQAVYDALPGTKMLAHFPELTHTSSRDFYEMSWEWLKRYV